MDTIGNIFTSGAATSENITDGEIISISHRPPPPPPQKKKKKKKLWWYQCKIENHCIKPTLLVRYKHVLTGENRALTGENVY